MVPARLAGRQTPSAVCYYYTLRGKVVVATFLLVFLEEGGRVIGGC